MTAVETPASPVPTLELRVAKPPQEPRPAKSAARQVAVRPIAAGLANAATIGASTLYYAAGATGLAVAAGGTAAVAAAGAGRRMAANRRASGSVLRSAPARVSGGGRGAGSRVGRSSAGVPSGARSGGTTGRGSTARGRAGSAEPARRRSGVGASPKGGAKGSGSAGTGRAGTGAANGNGRRGGAGNSRGGGFRRSGSTPGSGSRTPLTAARVAAARRAVAARRAAQERRANRQAGPRLSEAVRKATAPTPSGQRPTAGQAWRAARRDITGASPKRRGPVRRALAGVAAGLLAADKAHRERWRARKAERKAAKDAAKKDAGTTPRGNRGARPGVNGTVRRHPADTSTRPARRPAPAANTTRGSNPAPVNTSTGGTTMGHYQLRNLSEDFLTAAARDQPEGMLAVVADAHAAPEVLGNHATAMQLRYQRAQEHPLPPAVKDMYAAVHAASLAVVAAAEDIGPAIEKLCAAELERLRNPRPGEQMWDVRANQGGV